MAFSLRTLSRVQRIVIAGILIAVIVVVTGVVVASGGDDGKHAAPTTTSERATSTTGIEPVLAPLTGLPQDDRALLDRPALMVKVDNTPKGFAVQEGIDRADLVFVEQTEQGTTRLAAVFQSHDTTVGPVRSARTSDIGIAAALNRPVLAYSGANGGVLGQVRRAPLVDAGVDVGAVTSVYKRNQRGGSANLYRFFLPTAEIYAAKGDKGGTPSPLFDYRGKGEAPEGERVDGARIGYGGNASTVASYKWNGTGWDRSQNLRAHVMATGARVSPANVVILITPYRNSGFVDVTGAPSPQAVLEGAGDAYFLSEGRSVRGRWSRPGTGSPFAFTDLAGHPIHLTPGQTFVELAPGAGSATIIGITPPSTQP